MRLKLEATINFLIMGPTQDDFAVFGEMSHSLKMRINSLEIIRKCKNDQSIFIGAFDKKKKKLFLGGEECRILVMDY